MDIDGTKYFFKLGDKSPIIIRLKKFFNSRPYIKTKNNGDHVFDETFKATIIEFQEFRKLKSQDGTLNEEVYAAIGERLLPEDIDQISLGHPILKKLLYGIGLILKRITMAKGIPILIQNDVTPLHPFPGKTFIHPSNKNATHEAIDKKLAVLFGDEKQKPVVIGANQTGQPYVGKHYVLDNGVVYTIHIFGPTGNEFIDIFLPKEFEKPSLSPNANPHKVGYYGLVSSNKKTGAVLGFAHLDSIQSQADLDRAWNSKMTNSVGSRYIGTIGTSGGAPGNMHSHIFYFASLKARDAVRSRKIDTYDVRDPEYYVDFKTLVDSLR